MRGSRRPQPEGAWSLRRKPFCATFFVVTRAAETAPRAIDSSAPSLSNLAGVFTRYANLTFGGGSATIAVLHELVVARRRWSTP